MPTLSEAALALFRLHVERKGRIAVDNDTRPLYRELAREGLMLAGHDFTRGRESFYVLTEVGTKLIPVMERIPSGPSPAESA